MAAPASMITLLSSPRRAFEMSVVVGMKKEDQG